jgi:hypothetical protein
MPERTFPESGVDRSNVSRKPYARILLAGAAVANRHECFRHRRIPFRGWHIWSVVRTLNGALTDGGRVRPKVADSVA